MATLVVALKLKFWYNKNMRTIVAIGGGSIKDKTTLKIDEYIANLAKARAGEKRAYGLFIGTASHDCMPAFNSFRKTYTSVFDIKADCLLTVTVNTPKEKIDEKFSKADFIYVGGGDTLYMLEKWKEYDLLNKIFEAYKNGVIVCGLSAGAVCWFEKMYTDSDILNGKGSDYKIYDGVGLLKGTFSPHYNLRKNDFDKTIIENNIPYAYAVCDDSAVVFRNEEYLESISSGGDSFKIINENGTLNYIKLN